MMTTLSKAPVNTSVSISVCIPAYNRPEQLGPLLDSILNQGYDNFEIVICEDCSPKRSAISAVVSLYTSRFPNRIRYFQNETNLGYDGNLRELLRRASGDFVMLVGNDDLLAPDALTVAASAINRYPYVGVVLRSYATFRNSPERIYQVHRYFPSERFFPAGAESAATFFRRAVVVSGLMFHRSTALKYETAEFDGSLLYQVHIIANIMLEMNGVFVPQILALYRMDARPDFGNSSTERDKYVPGQQTEGSSLHFVSGFLQIARRLDEARYVSVFPLVLADTANYSYPLLAIQARQLSRRRFVSYGRQLAKLGLGHSLTYQLYYCTLLVFGPRVMDRLIAMIKARLGFTPAIGQVYSGTENP